MLDAPECERREIVMFNWSLHRPHNWIMPDISSLHTTEKVLLPSHSVVGDIVLKSFSERKPTFLSTSLTVTHTVNVWSPSVNHGSNQTWKQSELAPGQFYCMYSLPAEAGAGWPGLTPVPAIISKSWALFCLDTARPPGAAQSLLTFTWCRNTESRERWQRAENTESRDGSPRSTEGTSAERKYSCVTE